MPYDELIIEVPFQFAHVDLFSYTLKDSSDGHQMHRMKDYLILSYMCMCMYISKGISIYDYSNLLCVCICLLVCIPANRFILIYVCIYMYVYVYVRM